MRLIRTTNVFNALLISAAVLLSITVVGFESLRPHANAAVAIVFPPWVDTGAAIDRTTLAGAAAPRAGRYPFVAIVENASPSFRQRVRRQGALLVLDADKVGGYLDADGRSS